LGLGSGDRHHGPPEGEREKPDDHHNIEMAAERFAHRRFQWDACVGRSFGLENEILHRAGQAGEGCEVHLLRASCI